MSSELLYSLAVLAMIAAYLLVGAVFWSMVKARLEKDVHGMVILEQERQGHFAILIPKFSVIALWPLAGTVALAAAIWHSLRREAPAL
ncbi:hypothetical protein CC53_gp007 [Rhizobium phage vB_RleS_L338C]|uniref:hypothetical protein n=1 Tax=Rhizobium phage vB_RleS_L338C TaxID=1414737 RepID=UPI0003D8C7E8|nr:hypothetical protein CC53_gp007 [Rhizobium phage vB_RleS_L338C]AHC30424.1 hypothetical protein L338C_007 [Rhizobium phage vB_RleS_L338C]QNH72158.1 hypothetical protein P11VFA_130 [Rhizobium phage P11VFA]